MRRINQTWVVCTDSTPEAPASDLDEEHEVYITPANIAAVIANPGAGTGGFMTVPHDESGEDGTR